jgi:hypothetical protein
MKIYFQKTKDRGRVMRKKPMDRRLDMGVLDIIE